MRRESIYCYHWTWVRRAAGGGIASGTSMTLMMPFNFRLLPLYFFLLHSCVLWRLVSSEQSHIATGSLLGPPDPPGPPACPTRPARPARPVRPLGRRRARLCLRLRVCFHFYLFHLSTDAIALQSIQLTGQSANCSSAAGRHAIQLKASSSADVVCVLFSLCCRV